jgi:CO dehydrogenase/acetyl-CoA synthase beta subunit
MFDIYIQKITEYVERLQAEGRQTQVFDCQGPADKLKEDLPIRVGPRASPGIILREDTFIELGSPKAGSCAFILWTDKTSLISDGRITLIGPDIQESPGQSLPFGQVVMVGGTELSDKEDEVLRHLQYIGDRIEGYMVRSLSRNIWSRVSKDVAGKGFSFEVLGRALRALYKSANARIEKMETIFVTSSKEDIGLLDQVAAQVQKINKEIVRQTWKIRGYDIDCAFDCSSCADKPVCDDIREVLQLKRGKEKSEETNYCSVR